MPWGETTARMHVLVVDDDPTMRDMIANYLETRGFRVTGVADDHAVPVLQRLFQPARIGRHGANAEGQPGAEAAPNLTADVVLDHYFECHARHIALADQARLVIGHLEPVRAPAHRGDLDGAGRRALGGDRGLPRPRR